MAHPDSSKTENQPVFSAFNCFLRKLLEEEWISQSSNEDVKNCLHSAKSIEKVLKTLDDNDPPNSFTASVPDLFGLSFSQLHKACDIVLTMVLTAPGASLSCVRTCIYEYFQLCGSSRFECVLSSTIFCSEIYRVLLDYLASFEGDLKLKATELQSHLVLRLWRAQSDTKLLKETFYKWLLSDPSGQNIAAALQVIIMSEEENIKSSLVLALVEVLQKRGDTAVTFWSILNKLPLSRKALERSDDLFNSVLEFLLTSSQWMEATPSFTWVSRENGPCKAFGYEKLINAVQCLLETRGPISEKTQLFLVKRKNSAGCTFWDDVEVGLNC